MLTEKFRPKTLEEIILPDSVKNLIKNYIEKGEMPNLLLYSESPGTGKTSLSHIIVKALDSEYIEINASKERGIDIVREVIEPFARTCSFNSKRKAILLSECEQLSLPAMKSLKDMLEGEVIKNVYYILTTNHKEKIIEPIRSRCIEIDFSHPPKDKIRKRLLFIAKEEKIDIEEPDIDSIIDFLYPDIRAMINSLDKVASGIAIEEAVGSELGFYELSKKLRYMPIKEIYSKIEEINIVSFLHYLFKVYLSWQDKEGLIFVKETLKDIMLGVDEKIAFMSNFVKLKKRN